MTFVADCAVMPAITALTLLNSEFCFQEYAPQLNLKLSWDSKLRCRQFERPGLELYWGEALSESQRRRVLKIMYYLPVPDFIPRDLGLAVGLFPRFKKPLCRGLAPGAGPPFSDLACGFPYQCHLPGNVGQSL